MKTLYVAKSRCGRTDNAAAYRLGLPTDNLRMLSETSINEIT